MNKRLKKRKIALFFVVTSGLAASVTAGVFAQRANSRNLNSYLDYLSKQMGEKYSDESDNFDSRSSKLKSIVSSTNFSNLLVNKTNGNFPEGNSIFANLNLVGNLKHNSNFDKNTNSTLLFYAKKNTNKAIDEAKFLSWRLRKALKNEINIIENLVFVSYINEKVKSYNEISKKLIDLIRRTEITKLDSKYLSATNEIDFDKKLEIAKSLVFDEKIDFNLENSFIDLKFQNIESLISELTKSTQNLNGTSTDQQIERFKKEVEKKLHPKLRDSLRNYSLEPVLYSANITKENKELFVTENKIEDVKLTFKDVYFDRKNSNNLMLLYRAESTTDPKIVANVVGKLVFKNDFKKKIDEIKFNDLDGLFEIDYAKLANFYKSDLSKFEDEISDLFVKKYTNISGIFKYKIAENTIKGTNDNKISFKVNFLVNNQVVHTLTLKTKNKISFLDEFWKGLQIEPSDNFKSSEFYQETENWSKKSQKTPFSNAQSANFNVWFVNNIFEQAKNSIPELKNKTLNTEVSWNLETEQKNNSDLNQKDIEKIYKEIQNNEKHWSKLFNISLPEGAKLIWENFTPIHRFFVAGNNAIFNFKVVKQGKEKTFYVYINVKKDDKNDQDFKDLTEIRKIIEINNDSKHPLKSSEKLMDLIKIKEKGKTHSNVNAKDAISAFNTLYSLPQIGKYQIYARDLISYENLTDNNKGGTAKIFFWIKKNGVPIEFDDVKSKLEEKDYVNKFTKTVYYFKPLNFTDIKPKNPENWFAFNDFHQEKGTFPIQDQQLIDKINSTNFEYQRTISAIINKNKTIKYAVLDPKDIVEQKAFSSLNYLLKLKTSQKIDDESKNFEPFKEDIIKRENLKQENISNFYTSSDDIANRWDRKIATDLSKITKNYFMYFYDVRNLQQDSLTFKLGFINKKDPKIRYSSGREITLVNLHNDFKENLYPEIMLNRIGISDFSFKINENSKNISSPEELNRLIVWKNPSIIYQNFQIRTSDIKIAEIKKDEKSNYYVKLKYTSPVSRRTFLGNNWYKIEKISANFAKVGLNFANEKLQTTFNSATSITREREIEPYFKDLIWEFDSQKQSASWILKNKYIEKTLLKQGSTNRKIKLTLFGNQLIQDDFRLKRIVDKDKNYSFEFDFEDLISGKNIEKEAQTKVYTKLNGQKYPQFSFILRAEYLKDKGIKFHFELKDKEYKMIMQNPYSQVASPQEVISTGSDSRFGEFLKEKAFLLNPAAASVNVVYTNSIEHEDFGQFTNQFDYKNLDFNQENQPILFYTPETIINQDGYNPNQNVSYELHNGYLLDQEYAHPSWKHVNAFNSAFDRSFGFGMGTGTQIAKVNSDPNDYRFYVVVNRHMLNVKNFSELSYEKLGQKSVKSYITKPANNFENNVNPGFSYWHGSNNVKDIPIQIIWSGVDQKVSKNQKVKNNDIDITVFAVDIKDLLKKAKSEGKLDFVSWFENWSKMQNLKLNNNWSENGFFPASNIRKYSIVGFPYGKQASYYINRVKTNDSIIALANQNGYIPTFYNAGNSGTGILGSDGDYISTINSGVPLTLLESWNYDSASTNYFGVNFKNEHPLDLKNTNSLAAQIIRWHLKEPLNVNLPWFFKEFK